MVYKPYTPEDERFLVENYSTMPLRELAGRLDRTTRAIECKVDELGLRKRHVITPAIEGQIIKLFIKYFCHNDRIEGLDDVYVLIGDDVGMKPSAIKFFINTNYPLTLKKLPKER